MDKLQLVRRERLSPPEFSIIDSMVRRRMEHEMGDKLLSEIFDPERVGIICLSPTKYKSYFVEYTLSEHRLEIEREYAHSYPVIIFDGYSYENMPIRPPDTLSFFERVKFIITGNYPK